MTPDPAQRDARGRFTRGAQPGPGRPAHTTSPPEPQIGDDVELQLRAMAQRDLEQTWRRIIDAHGIEFARELAREARKANRWVPAWPELAA